jgi:hypothetical protein
VNRNQNTKGLMVFLSLCGEISRYFVADHFNIDSFQFTIILPSHLMLNNLNSCYAIIQLPMSKPNCMFLRLEISSIPAVETYLRILYVQITDFLFWGGNKRALVVSTITYQKSISNTAQHHHHTPVLCTQRTNNTWFWYIHKNQIT